MSNTLEYPYEYEQVLSMQRPISANTFALPVWAQAEKQDGDPVLNQIDQIHFTIARRSNGIIICGVATNAIGAAANNRNGSPSSYRSFRQIDLGDRQSDIDAIVEQIYWAIARNVLSQRVRRVGEYE